MNDTYYFGCFGQPGHYLFLPSMTQEHSDVVAKLPWGAAVDGQLCPQGKQVQGHSKLHHKDGWTALAFWDRSVDTREGSNSVFLLKGEHSFPTMKEQFKRSYPQITGRLSFPIMLVH